ncbi:MAG: MBL fold metallo-hydrolase [Anaerolineales bacterium]
MITLTVLYDNNAYDTNLTTAWGFSCLIERADSSGEEAPLLFDTGGQGELLLNNMNALNKDPHAIATVILSHNHGDHTGGLSHLLQQGIRPEVYVPASFPASTKNQIRAAAELVEVDAPAEIAPGIWTTGQVSGPIPEQAIVVETAEGWVVITGCAHPGIVEMVRAAKQATGGEILLVMGGFHLGSASEREIARIIEELQALDVQRVAPLHCTGDAARQQFAAAYDEACDLVGVGATYAFER